jgi:hypothetical protein
LPRLPEGTKLSNMNVFEFGKQHLTLTADALHGALPKWPVLTIVHFIITSIALRMEPGIIL